MIETNPANTHFENVQLPSTVIAELYKQTLVVLQDVQPAPKKDTPKAIKIITEPAGLKPAVVETIVQKNEQQQSVATTATPLFIPAERDAKDATAPTFKYLGGFEKQVAILVSEHFNPDIAEEDLEFLSKMLSACKLSLKDVAIINVVANPNINQLWQLMPPKVMLMFDVDPGTLGLPFRRPHFEVQEWAGSTFMNAPELEKFRIGNEQELKMLKTKLWLCLQKIFLVN